LKNHDFSIFTKSTNEKARIIIVSTNKVANNILKNNKIGLLFVFKKIFDLIFQIF
jgi:hypothetical protein